LNIFAFFCHNYYEYDTGLLTITVYSRCHKKNWYTPATSSL